MSWYEKVKSEKPNTIQDKFRQLENVVVSSLPLQILLYFNITFLPVWIVMLMLFLINQYHCLEATNKLVLLVVMVPTVLIELARLYMGHQGNLREKVPELTGFWLLSVLLQLPLQCVLSMHPYFRWQVAEVVCHAVMGAMLVLEILAGFRAVRRTASHQAATFRIMNPARSPHNVY